MKWLSDTHKVSARVRNRTQGLLTLSPLPQPLNHVASESQEEIQFSSLWGLNQLILLKHISCNKKPKNCIMRGGLHIWSLSPMPLQALYIVNFNISGKQVGTHPSAKRADREWLSDLPTVAESGTEFMSLDSYYTALAIRQYCLTSEIRAAADHSEIQDKIQ